MRGMLSFAMGLLAQPPVALRFGAGVLAIAGALCALLPQQAAAQPYPTRPVRIVVGFAAGGTPDILARLIGPSLSDRLGQPFIVENRPGAGSNTAAELVIRSPADGYTLLLVQTPNAINATLFEKLAFNFIRDTAPIAALVRQPQVMMINPDVPARTVAEFIAHAKANPGKLNMASTGLGTSNHVAGEMFNLMAGVKLVHVPYRGGAPALNDLMTGQVQVMFIGPAGSIEYIRAGKLRALAVTTLARSPALPDVPTVAEVLPGYESSAWFGLSAPSGTPAEIIEALNAATRAALADGRIAARIADMGAEPIPGTPAEFGRLVAEETEKWARVVREAGLKVQ